MSCYLGIETNCDECRMCQDKKEEEQTNTETAKERKDDLISRERVTQEISEIMANALISGFLRNAVSFDELNHKIQECLKNQTVAYDVDKVVEQLEELKGQAESDMQLSDEYAEAQAYGGMFLGYDKIIGIVKAGGVNE